MKRFWHNLFARKNHFQRPSKLRQPRRLVAEALEDRRLLSVAPYVPVAFGPVSAGGPALVGSFASSGQTLVATHTTITASTLAAATNQAVTFTATVTGSSTGTPGGIVDFYDGAVKIGSGTLSSSGKVTFTTSILGLGIHNIFATYEGNATYHGSSSATPCAVSICQGFPTNTTLTVSNVTIFGQLATLTATVNALNGNAGIPAGSVTFYISNSDGLTWLRYATLSQNGTATLTGVQLPAGENIITADYVAAGQFDPSYSSRCERDIARASSAMTLATSLPSATTGQNLTFTASVASLARGTGTPSTGPVSFYDGTTLLATVQLNSSGIATFSTAALKAGNHTIRAVYALTSDFLASSASITQKVVAVKAP